MAALAFGICAVIRELCTLSDAFVRCGYSVNKSFKYLHAKNRLKLFRKYCEVIWLQYEYELLSVNDAVDSNSNNFATAVSGTSSRNILKMRRRPAAGGIIDFAAVEADAMAMEAMEGNIVSPRNVDVSEPDAFIAYESEQCAADFEQLENLDDIEVISGVEIDLKYYDYIDSHPQCREVNLGELKEGVAFTVTGRILLTCERFAINFLVDNPTNDIALHINPRLPQDYIVRNTRVRGVWGREEIATQLPFNLHRGTQFSIQVLITENAFMVSSNGYHFADYKHQLPYRTIKSIEVKGDVENVKIERRVVNSYPDRQSHSTYNIRSSLLMTPFRDTPEGNILEMAFYDTLQTDVVIPTQWRVAPSKRQSVVEEFQMPYIGRFKRNSLIDGCAICITGRIKLLPHSFYINLQDGPNIWPHQNVAFHFNPRFPTRGATHLGKAVVCRNAWYDGKWGKEERSELDTNLRPGKKFVLMIRCTKDSFIVYVDRKLVTTFRYQLKPSMVNTLYIRGDVKLLNITLRSPTLNTESETHITDNPSFTSDEFEYLDESQIGAQVKTKGIEAISNGA